jgi:ATP-dependent DNA helicase RecQ
LREFLRDWRRTTAKEQGVPAYVVLHDTSLDEICQNHPSSIDDLLEITGIGERKADLYGQKILAALQRYRQGARATAQPEKKTAPALETLQLLNEGKTFEEIAKVRGRQLGTVISAVTALVSKKSTSCGHSKTFSRLRLATTKFDSCCHICVAARGQTKPKYRPKPFKNR